MSFIFIRLLFAVQSKLVATFHVALFLTVQIYLPACQLLRTQCSIPQFGMQSCSQCLFFLFIFFLLISTFVLLRHIRRDEAVSPSHDELLALANEGYLDIYVQEEGLLGTQV